MKSRALYPTLLQPVSPIFSGCFICFAMGCRISHPPSSDRFGTRSTSNGLGAASSESRRHRVLDLPGAARPKGLEIDFCGPTLVSSGIKIQYLDSDIDCECQCQSFLDDKIGFWCIWHVYSPMEPVLYSQRHQDRKLLLHSTLQQQGFWARQ